MSVTAEDYQRAVDGFLEDLGRLGDDVVSVLLFGSMAMGTLRPGKSDLLDAVVFLRDETFRDRGRFLRALSVMTDACDRLSRCGIYFHPFVYWNERDPLPASFFVHSALDSSFIYGQDIRERFGPTEASSAVFSTAFFHQRRLAFPLIGYLYKKGLTPRNCRDIIYSLVQAGKQLPVMVCAAFGLRHEGTRDAVVKMREALPGLDLGLFARLDAMRDLGDEELDPEQVRAVLREALELDDRLNDLILARRRGAAGA